MRLTSSTHNHTNLCDGRNTPDEMARAALEAGFTDFGFSGHSYAPFDLDYSVKSEQHYVQELRALQKAYAGRLRIAVGMEADWFAPVNDRAALDYIIGSVHYLRDEATGRYYAVDGAPEALDACVTQMFGGVKKNNCGGHLFDEADPVYRTAALEALDACAATGAVFEVNTGGMFRGYCGEPYPSRFLLEALRKSGARVTVNADAHCTEAVRFRFDETLALLRDIGFTAVTVLEDGMFVEKPL